jgi:hypothetical protein
MKKYIDNKRIDLRALVEQLMKYSCIKYDQFEGLQSDAMIKKPSDMELGPTPRSNFLNMCSIATRETFLVILSNRPWARVNSISEGFLIIASRILTKNGLTTTIVLPWRTKANI